MALFSLIFAFGGLILLGILVGLLIWIANSREIPPRAKVLAVSGLLIAIFFRIATPISNIAFGYFTTSSTFGVFVAVSSVISNVLEGVAYLLLSLAIVRKFESTQADSNTPPTANLQSQVDSDNPYRSPTPGG